MHTGCFEDVQSSWQEARSRGSSVVGSGLERSCKLGAGKVRYGVTGKTPEFTWGLQHQHQGADRDASLAVAL